VRAAAPNMASRAAVIIDVRKGRLLSCGYWKWWRLTKLGKEQIVPRLASRSACASASARRSASRSRPSWNETTSAEGAAWRARQAARPACGR